MGSSSVQVTFALSYFCCIPFLQKGGIKLTSWQPDTSQSLTYWILSDRLGKILIIKNRDNLIFLNAIASLFLF